MNMKVIAVCAILSCICPAQCFVDFGLTILAGGIAFIGFKAKSLYNYYHGDSRKCDNFDFHYEPAKELKMSLSRNLYGQHLVLERLIPLLEAHLSVQPKKSLVISLHGWTGGGKTYLTQLLANSLFKDGTKSPFLKMFSGPLHFPFHSQDRVQVYWRQLQEDLQKQVSRCPRSVIVFDEVDKMPPGLVDAIKPYLDHHHLVDGKEFRHLIFIFISNTDGGVITKQYLNLWKSGVLREHMEYKHYEHLLRRAVYTEKGGLYGSNVISSSLIDLYLPFLPLNKEHVQQCAYAEMKRQGIPFSKETTQQVQKLVEELEFDEATGQLSTSGCTHIANKVSTLRAKWELDHQKPYS